MEMKNHDFADHDIKDHEKIDDDKSVEDSESTEEVNKDVALRKNTNRIHKTISEEGKKIIVDYMEDWKKERKPSNPFKMLAKKLKDSCDYDYNSKAICD
uniref:Uncharacterized protein n=1 Tax=Rhizophagus irregularis (strain DAOM 181602 / DAOM 197198 / MUCL 43194) TaxID=747089 RepID=U9UWZ9_RHIID